jgi:hypothetical protein
MQEPFEFSLRVLARAGDDDRARAVAARVERALGPWAHVTSIEVQRYYKIPELHEVSLVLEPAGPAPAAYDAIIAAVAAGEWSRGGSDLDWWAVWDADSGAGASRIDGVVWASLSGHPRATA